MSNIQKADHLIAIIFSLLEDVSKDPALLELVQKLAADAIEEAFTESSIRLDTSPPIEEFDSAIEDLLDPNISIPLTTAIDSGRVEKLTAAGPLERFNELAKMYPGDPWIIAVGTVRENLEIWKQALVFTYAVVTGPERKSYHTWVLIERTYRMLRQKMLDTAPKSGQNDGAV